MTLLTPAPHVHGTLNTTRIMYGVCIGLLPAAAAGIFLFGVNAAMLLLASVSTCVLAEALFQKIRGKKLRITDGSAVLTGLLLGLVIPPGLPIWMVILAAVFAIGIGKEIFGGLGHTIFNPALVGRAFLSAAFPAAMSRYPAPFIGSLVSGKACDAVSAATPLGLHKFESAMTPYADLFSGAVGGSIGETSALALLAGGLYIIARGYADWRIPAAFLGTLFVSAEALHYFSPGVYAPGVFHILAGGALIGALFMATDPVTSPVTRKGRWIFGAGCGALVIIMRTWGGQPEGVMYSILLMNSIVPLLNRVTGPARYGTERRKAV